ncbi:PstS family phosphate ABC transporter substrate-binding protein [Flavobacterium sp. '19STA2R22 D10 B1']|uniref:PstS family phosphate ABC transporter substrate-binding protein n=1 Tax=Flavobacterium aerium TaxID=3037261 RepID=UPI00278C6EE6|nr:substrate-binding domain-containing protein [Flavobacterium sp. '19STA2R22 D10 B1']
MTVKLNATILKVTLGICTLFIFSCNSKEDKKLQTLTQGQASILVDESFEPVMQAQLEVFQNQYTAKITLVNKPESEAIKLLLSDSINIAILSRELNADETKALAHRNIVPKITPFATDAIALITDTTSKDTLVDLQEVINFIQGKPSKVKRLVFDNPGSSTVRYMKELAKVDNLPTKEVYSLKSNDEVIKYVAENPGAIGVIGVNWVLQPSTTMQQYVEKVKIMGVKNVKGQVGDNEYNKPTQSSIGGGLYPLTRQLYVLNYQGGSGLGMGFASFVAGEIGQRIILKSGLLPVRLPSRQIKIQK